MYTEWILIFPGFREEYATSLKCQWAHKEFIMAGTQKGENKQSGDGSMTEQGM